MRRIALTCDRRAETDDETTTRAKALSIRSALRERQPLRGGVCRRIGACIGLVEIGVDIDEGGGKTEVR